MAIRLYPPTIENNLPAFYKNYDKNGHLLNATIIIPFGVSRAVSINDIASLSCRFRTVSTNTLVFKEDLVTDVFDKNLSGNAYFNIPDSIQADKLNEGQYYKVQLAFIDQQGITGYYSTVGIIKCVMKPTVTLGNDFKETTTNIYKTEFVGEYHQDTSKGDSTEKEYSYRFIMTNEYEEIIADSGVQIHDNTADTLSDQSSDFFKVYKEIPDGTIGYIQYIVTTINGLTISSKKYKIMKAMSIDILKPIKLYAQNNFENGYIELTLKGEKNLNTNTEDLISGIFVITRSDHKSDYMEWQEVRRFAIPGDYPSNYMFRDMTVEQGVKYRYGIQQYNNYKIYSNKIYAINKDDESLDYIYSDFEDMFLYDGNRQLKIRFNPKVASFKNTIPEQKIETIGSKYPFIFRNGHVNYKEFPIGGLLAYQMDDALLFINNSAEWAEGLMLEPTLKRGSTNIYQKDAKIDIFEKQNSIEYHIYNDDNYNLLPIKAEYNNKLKYYIKEEDGSYTTYTYKNYNQWKEDIASGNIYVYNLTDYDIQKDAVRITTNLTSENIMSERYFKLKVLDWLTDGRVKLFRSPTEGNYLVRLLNVSMTPQDTLGRMIHSFTSTAYEIADINYDNLLYYHIITDSSPLLLFTQWKTGQPQLDMNNFEFQSLGNIGEDVWEKVFLEDFGPGDIIRLTYKGQNTPDTFIIGPTGNFEFSIEGNILDKIEIKLNPENNFQDFSRLVNHTYKGRIRTKFDTVADIKTNTRIAEAFVGPKDNLMANYDIMIRDGEKQENLQKRIQEAIESRNYINFVLGDNDKKIVNLNVELLHVRKRIIIPVYKFDNDKYAVTVFGKGYVKGETIAENIYSFSDSDRQFLVPIEEIPSLLQQQKNFPLQFEYDGYAVLEVFMPDGKNWVPANSAERYYDTYTHEWWNAGETPNYTFSIGASEDFSVTVVKNTGEEFSISGLNEISLEQTEEMYLKNLGPISVLSLGNCVMAEVTCRLQIIDYDVEEIESFQTYEKKRNYLQAKQDYELALDNYVYNFNKKRIKEQKVGNGDNDGKLQDQVNQKSNKIEELTEALTEIQSDNFKNPLFFRANNILKKYQKKKLKLFNGINLDIPDEQEFTDIGLQESDLILLSDWVISEDGEPPLILNTYNINENNVEISRQVTSEITNTLFRELFNRDISYKQKLEDISQKVKNVQNIANEKQKTSTTQFEDIQTYKEYRDRIKELMSSSEKENDGHGLQAFNFWRPWDSLVGGEGYISSYEEALNNLDENPQMEFKEAFQQVFIFTNDEDNDTIYNYIENKIDSNVDSEENVESMLSFLNEKDFWVKYNGFIIEYNRLNDSDNIEYISKNDLIESLSNILFSLKEKDKILPEYIESIDVITEADDKQTLLEQAINLKQSYETYQESCQAIINEEEKANNNTLTDEELSQLKAVIQDLDELISDQDENIKNLRNDLLDEKYIEALRIKAEYDNNEQALRNAKEDYGEKRERFINEIENYKIWLSNFKNLYNTYKVSLEYSDDTIFDLINVDSIYTTLSQQCDKILTRIENITLDEEKPIAVILDGDGIPVLTDESTANERCAGYEAIMDILLSIQTHCNEYEAQIQTLQEEKSELENEIAQYNNYDEEAINNFNEQELKNNIKNFLVEFLAALGIDFKHGIKERYG